jgi:HEPN domain-containing protein
MPERSKDWMNQAVKDLEAAEKMKDNDLFEWSCFAAQQSSEKAVKSVLQRLNAVAWGHSITDLMKVLGNKVHVEEKFLDCARLLDKNYIPARYPNGFESGSPYEYFTRKDAEDAIICSRSIIEFCNGLLA